MLYRYYVYGPSSVPQKIFGKILSAKRMERRIRRASRKLCEAIGDISSIISVRVVASSAAATIVARAEITRLLQSRGLDLIPLPPPELGPLVRCLFKVEARIGRSPNTTSLNWTLWKNQSRIDAYMAEKEGASLGPNAFIYVIPSLSDGLMLLPGADLDEARNALTSERLAKINSIGDVLRTQGISAEVGILYVDAQSLKS